MSRNRSVKKSGGGSEPQRAPRETKSEKFERIAERRVNEALRALRLLGNLADRRNYEYTDDQVSSFIRVLDKEYRALRLRFSSDAGAGEEPFRFSKES